MKEKRESVLVLGASPNSSRYSHMATVALCEKGHSVVLVGSRRGEIRGREIQLEFPLAEVNIDTITLYLNPTRQFEYYDLILNSGVKRIIMNPGTENRELADKAISKGIKVDMACTLVMLSVGTF